MDPERLRYGIKRYLNIKSAYGARFSPDGRRVAYITDVTGVPQVWALELGCSGGPQQLTSEDDRVGHVSYSRKHETIAYSLDEGGNERFQIMLLERDGAFRRALTSNKRAIHSWGGWSGDGRSVSYSSNARHPAFFDIYVHRIDEEQPRMVYRQDGSNYPVRWSPRVDSLLFVRTDGNFDHQLYRLDVADENVEHLTPHTGEAVYGSATFDPLSEASTA